MQREIKEKDTVTAEVQCRESRCMYILYIVTVLTHQSY